MHAILIESGFMTNDRDFENIFGKNHKEYRQKCALSVAKAILEWFGIDYMDDRPEYDMSASLRLGEVVIKDEPMNYRTRPDINAPIIRVLPAGHGKDSPVHVYEVKGDWLRLGQGWISNAEGAYATVKWYNDEPEKPKEPKKEVYGVAGYNDVKKDAYYAEAIEKVKKAGIMEGYSDDKFGVGDYVKREDLAVALARALKL